MPIQLDNRELRAASVAGLLTCPKLLGIGPELRTQSYIGLPINLPESLITIANARSTFESSMHRTQIVR